MMNELYFGSRTTDRKREIERVKGLAAWSIQGAHTHFVAQQTYHMEQTRFSQALESLVKLWNI